MKKIAISKFPPEIRKFFRITEKSAEEVTITDHGKPVLKIIPYEKNRQNIFDLKDKVLKYDNP